MNLHENLESWTRRTVAEFYIAMEGDPEPGPRPTKANAGQSPPSTGEAGPRRRGRRIAGL